jgi:hypothetical protein
MEIKLNKSTVSKIAARVNSKRKSVSRRVRKTQTPTATRLVPVLLRRGKHEGFFHAPACTVCHKPVLDFEAANVVVVGFDPDGPKESLGTIDGAEAFRLPGTAVVVHFDCDQERWTPWVRSSSVFSKDQRSPIEKLGWSGVVS